MLFRVSQEENFLRTDISKNGRWLLSTFRPHAAQTSSWWWNGRSWSNGSLGLLPRIAQSCLQKLPHQGYSQTHTCHRNCRERACGSPVATKHLCSPCSCGLARSCTRFSCMFPLPGKSAGRTLWSWRARSLCSRRRARENCTSRASGCSPTAALSSCRARVCKRPSLEYSRWLARRCTMKLISALASSCFRESQTWPGSTPNQTRTRSRRRRWRSRCD